MKAIHETLQERPATKVVSGMDTLQPGDPVTLRPNGMIARAVGNDRVVGQVSSVTVNSEGEATIDVMFALPMPANRITASITVR